MLMAWRTVSNRLQGSLGDCFFSSTLSAMAEFPQRIQKLFETSENELSGCYKVKIMDGIKASEALQRISISLCQLQYL